MARKAVNVTPIHMTCGLKSKTEYCMQTHGIYRECDYCDDSQEDKRHPPEYLTDIQDDHSPTWWQSVTMLDDVHVRPVNLTVNLGEIWSKRASFIKKGCLFVCLPLHDPDEYFYKS